MANSHFLYSKNVINETDVEVCSMESLENAPSDVSSFFTSDEKLLKTASSQEWDVYVTNKRVLLKKGGIFGKEFVEASNHHISSIEYKKNNPLPSIIAGIVLIGFALISNFFLGQIMFIKDFSIFISAILTIIGIVVIISAFLSKPTLKLHIVGRKPITLSSKLEGIIRIIRENQ